MLEASYSLLNEYQLILHMTSLVIWYKQNSPVDTLHTCECCTSGDLDLIRCVSALVNATLVADWID